MRPYLITSEKKTLLDVGCGQGDFINIIQQNPSLQIEAFGIEPSISQETQNLKKRK